MSNEKFRAKGNVPFSWENEPGVRKETSGDRPIYLGRDAVTLKLPPPPSFRIDENGKTSLSPAFRDLQNIPLPPCAFQGPTRSGSRRGIYQDDPFLKAYKECTKSKRGRKNVSIFSCKSSSCSVTDDSIVRISQLPISNGEKEMVSLVKLDD